MTKTEIFWRGVIYVTLAVFGFLLTSEEFRTQVGTAGVLWIGALNAGLIGLRAFLDKSPAQGEPDADTMPMPVTVENPASQPVPTEETGGEPTEG